ncbi:MAG: alpha-glucosidase [Cucumibacter sp.]
MTGAATLPAPAADPDWWRGGVLYQNYPRSFQDSNGDGVGDLAGISQRLDYVADLGVDGIWLSPFFTSPMKDFGYDVADYCGVDPVFGTIEDFKRLLQRAHGFGLKVIIDQVLSHTSDKHAWFVESRRDKTNPRADWYIWADAKPDGSAPNNWLAMFGGPAWTWDPRRCQYYMHNFLASQPDLNYHNKAVREAILETCRFWLDLGVNGFRLDTVNYFFHSRGLESNPPVAPEDYNASTAPSVNPYNLQNHIYDKTRPENLTFLREVRTLLDRYPARTSVGEIGDAQRQLELMAAYTSGGDKLHMAYTFDFLGGEFAAPYVRDHIAAVEAIIGDGWPCWAFSNHDVVRHLSRWGVEHGSEARFAKFCAMILLTLRGSVCLYQGEELGLTEAELGFADLVDPYGIEFWPNYKGRDGCRTPMVWQSSAHLGGFSTAPKAWLPVAADHLARAADLQTHDENSVLGFYRALVRLRRRHKALIMGSIELLDSPETVLAYIRRHGGEAILCAFNMSGAPATFTPPGKPKFAELEAIGPLAARTGTTLKLGPWEGWLGRHS